jgi:hypothetical protein
MKSCANITGEIGGTDELSRTLQVPRGEEQSLRRGSVRREGLGDAAAWQEHPCEQVLFRREFNAISRAQASPSKEAIFIISFLKTDREMP